jgi:hypothetical protein
MRHFAKNNSRITHYLEDKHLGQSAGKAWNGDFADVFCGLALEVVVLLGCTYGCGVLSRIKFSARAASFSFALPKLKFVNTRKKNADGRVVLNRG